MPNQIPRLWCWLVGHRPEFWSKKQECRAPRKRVGDIAGLKCYEDFSLTISEVHETGRCARCGKPLQGEGNEEG